MRALQSADVILFDDLVSNDVLELARREARRMLVGKRGQRESCRQEDICQLMVTLAKAGKHVVRLKGGDPMIFGRAGEEIAQLDQANIPVSVVPGVTAALAMASALGVSLTHRDHAQSVRFVTGHSRKGELPDNLDWQAIADPTATNVFYMGGRTVAGITDKLIAHRLPANTPAVYVTNLTRNDETRWVGTLDQLPASISTEQLTQPLLIGIGKAFSQLQKTAMIDSITKEDEQKVGNISQSIL